MRFVDLVEFNKPFYKYITSFKKRTRISFPNFYVSFPLKTDPSFASKAANYYFYSQIFLKRFTSDTNRFPRYIIF
ncbi:hypothetical protein A0128_05410 [Leptospira tipperaryensis]|uniref:Uncharacterized protein n=1 Tax=Leptospira tipperaryensis TaxID=2564040 RepID=A0A1D7UUQ7_9LEPT|nr:hypothetical protein A0128_05410 [Leptospira tipperaryensis]